MAATAKLTSGPVLLENISWETYERLLREVGERSIRLTYDNGDLEIMTLSFGHENLGEIIARLIAMLTMELNMPMRSGGSTTLRKRLKRTGIEPDKCFWIENERAMRGKTKWDAKKDPPPDLAVEVDVTRSSLNRMGIYAALGIAEVWRYRAKTLRVYVLEQGGTYCQVAASSHFPDLPTAKLNEFLQAARTADETTLLKNFAAWVRAHVVPSARGKPPGGRELE